MKFIIPKDKANYYLYFLELEDRFYYVGITRNIQNRLSQHRRGKGSVVTRAHRPLRLICAWYLGQMTYEVATHIEDEFTIYFMSRYGNRVRGGRWCKTKENVKEILKRNVAYSPCEQFPIEMEEQIICKKPHKKRTKKRRRKTNKYARG